MGHPRAGRSELRMDTVVGQVLGRDKDRTGTCDANIHAPALGSLAGPICNDGRWSADDHPYDVGSTPLAPTIYG